MKSTVSSNLDYSIELSTRPEAKYIGDIAIWNESEKALPKRVKPVESRSRLIQAMAHFMDQNLILNFVIALVRIWQCGTIQLDMNLPERFDITYIDKNNQKSSDQSCFHRAIFGSMERFIGILD